MTNTPFERIWDQHVIDDYGGGRALIHIDRHFAHEGTSARAFDGLRRAGLKMRRPDLTVGTIDHGISTFPGRTLVSWKPSAPRNLTMKKNCEEFGVRLFSIDDPRHGIVHVAGPHLGFALPGTTYVCGDSHTASCGGVGAWAWGIGTTEVMQVFATQTLIMRKPKTLLADFRGVLPAGIYAKDIILALIGRYGVDAGIGHVVEYGGPVIRAMPVEGRMTVSNMSIEFGARGGIVAADDTTFEYLNGREMAPKGALWDQAVRDWRALFDTEGAAYDRVIRYRLFGAEAAGHVGKFAAGCAVDRSGGARSVVVRFGGSEGYGGPRAGVYGTDAGDADRGVADRYCVYRVLHQRAAVRSAGGGGGCSGPQGCSWGQGDRGGGGSACEAGGGS